MKKLLALIGVLLSYYGSAQTATVTYTPSTANFANPERGFYRHTETHSDSYSNLNQTTLTNYRLNNNYTLILRVFYLENFVSSPISSTYLTAMQNDFNKIRAAGLKCVVRFAYSDDNDNGNPQDATKAQVLSHIAQLKPYLLANADIIAVAQAGFIGAWGEWYYTDNFGMEPNAQDYANRKAVVDALLGSLPSSRMVQIRTPSLKQNTYSAPNAITQNQVFNSSSVTGLSNIARVGHHNDCFLASADDYGTYNNITTEYTYLEAETRFLPMGGETCKVNLPRSGCASALNEMVKFHWSYLNLDYHPGVIDGFESGSCFPEIEKRLGYRLEFTQSVFPQSATAGTPMAVNVKIRNTGFASIYNPRNAIMILRNTITNQEFAIPFVSNPRLWAAGTTTTIAENLALPSNIPSGLYKLYLHMPDLDPVLKTRPEYAIRMANEGVWEAATGYNDLKHTVNIGTSLGVADNTLNNMRLYPVPTDNELTIEYDGISEYKALVYNSIGQQIGVNPTVSGSKMTINTESLSNGVYFVQLGNGQQKETRKFIVRH